METLQKKALESVKKQIDEDEKNHDRIMNMCANCMIANVDLVAQGKTLLQCSICNKTKYCSKECQKKDGKCIKSPVKV